MKKNERKTTERKGFILELRFLKKKVDGDIFYTFKCCFHSGKLRNFLI